MTSGLFDLHGRVALVTGARSGIGAEIAVGLAEAGADVVLHGHRDDLGETESRVRSVGGRPVRRWVHDLSKLEGLAAEAGALATEMHIDILVNNAGIIRRAPAADYPARDWRDLLTVNLDAVFTITQAVGGSMLERGHGKVITVASILAFQGGVNVVGYTASKHAVIGMTRALANEWTGRGVQVNAIAPGYVVTDNTRALREDRERERVIRERIPAGRWGEPRDLVGAAVFLAAPASDYVSGHALVVDGGWLAR